MGLNLRRVPIAGWTQCVHEAATFDSRAEYGVALLLDSAKALEWWARNDPPFLRIPSAIGYMEPDFVYKRKDQDVYGALEVKGGIFWNGSESDAQIKARSAVEWVKAANTSSLAVGWEFIEVLEDDALKAQSFEELHKVAVVAEPAPPSSGVARADTK